MDDLNSIAARHGDDFYVLDIGKFRGNFLEMRQAFRNFYPSTEIAYSYKTNYTPELGDAVHALGGYAEVVSAMEYHLARRLGVPGNRVVYNGPYKSAESFVQALVEGAIVNLDSERDLGLLVAASSQHSEGVFEVVLRCNFALSTGAVSRFGFDVAGEAFRRAVQCIEALPNVTLAGLHCHFPDRELGGYFERAEGLVALARSVFGQRPPKYLNIGGGYLGRLPESLVKAKGMTPVTYGQYAETIAGVFAKAFGDAPNPPLLILEPGTALVADTMKFFTRVVDIKSVRGRHYATVSGSIFSISPIARNTHLPVRVHSRSGGRTEPRTYSVVGFTCIEGDVLSNDLVASLSEGDFLEFDNTGSYSIVMKPPFILPASPILAVGDAGEELRVIRTRETFDHVFDNFVGF